MTIRAVAEPNRGVSGSRARALSRAAGNHLRGQLVDVMAGAQLGDRGVKRPCRAGDQRSELPLVALMAGVDIDDDLRGAQVKSLVRGIESGLKSEYENVYRVDVVAIGGAQAVTT